MLYNIQKVLKDYNREPIHARRLFNAKAKNDFISYSLKTF